MTTETYHRIQEFIRQSDLPRKPQKLDGLKRAFFKRHPLDLRNDILLLAGTSIDPSELENGHWL